MIKIGVTGYGGQLSLCLEAILPSFPELNIVFFDKAKWDITDKSRSEALIAEGEFDYLINTAAFTAVDLAEVKSDLSMTINGLALEHLSRACSDHNCHLIHISSDYVYHNRLRRPLTEKDPCTPKSQYGKSKLKGDEIILNNAASATILRTSWIYSRYGNNFLRTMIKLGKSHDRLSVIQDQWGCPTSAHEIAELILSMIKNRQLSSDQNVIYHYTHTGFTNWYEFAVMIFKMAKINVQVTPIDSASYGAKAPRPHFSILNCSRLEEDTGIKRQHWTEALSSCLSSIS
ncbi:MAG: dTDP-4-dehydrorhamnose reductase [Saprospiraceae bacterium]|nr:dTDP-4-dehydrorhamnose reductase [Saprospiraceae bacterium]